MEGSCPLRGQRNTSCVPLCAREVSATHVMKHVDPVGALGGLAVVHDVGDQVIGGILVHGLHFLRQVLSQIHIPGNGENKARTSDKGYQARETVLHK